MRLEGFYIGLVLGIILTITGILQYKFPKYFWKNRSENDLFGRDKYYTKDQKYGYRADGVSSIIIGSILLLADLIVYFATYK
jgi:tetrahydromethanopterin S-methyltransferase subunit F